MKRKFVLSMLVFLSTVTLTACSLQFEKATEMIKQKVAEEVAHQAGELITEKLGELVDSTDLQNDEELSDMAESFLHIVSEDSIKEALGVFSEATLKRVVDGDTIVVTIQKEEYKVRLIGANTPESVASEEYLNRTGKENTQEGKVASQWLADFLPEGTKLYLQKDTSDTDRYGRLLRYVWLELPKNETDIDEVQEKMLNAILLKEGLAEVSIYKPDTKYADMFTAIESGTTDDYLQDR